MPARHREVHPELEQVSIHITYSNSEAKSKTFILSKVEEAKAQAEEETWSLAGAESGRQAHQGVRSSFRRVRDRCRPGSRCAERSAGCVLSTRATVRTLLTKRTT